MKRVKETKDKSSVYRTMSLGKITSPTPLSKDEPRAAKTEGRGDLRGGKR